MVSGSPLSAGAVGAIMPGPLSRGWRRSTEVVQSVNR